MGWNMNKVQTDNDKRYIKLKIKLRLDNLPDKQAINVFDCFSGNGTLWDGVKKRTNKDINVLRIDTKNDRAGLYLKGDNLKFMNIDLSLFDIIDLDSYGIPYKQLKIVLSKGYKGIIHVTAIQSMMGTLPRRLLHELGYTPEMVSKIPTLFNRDGYNKIKQWLASDGIKIILGLSNGRKNYFVLRT